MPCGMAIKKSRTPMGPRGVGRMLWVALWAAGLVACTTVDTPTAQPQGVSAPPASPATPAPVESTPPRVAGATFERISIPGFDATAGGEPVPLVGHWAPAPATAMAMATGSGSGSARGAVLLLHGCGGAYDGSGQRLSSRMRTYTEWLHARGWSVLVLDSLTPRGERELCTQLIGTRRITQANRRLDAWAGLAWLARQPSVDPTRLGLIGWSHGGSTVLAALQGDRFDSRPRGVPLPAFGVAYYPGCTEALQARVVPVAPLLLQVGREDDWTPAEPCEQWVTHVHRSGARDASSLSLALYAGAYHGFDGTAPLRLRTDVPNGVRPGQGVHNGAHPPSREAAFARLHDWLGRYTSKLTP